MPCTAVVFPDICLPALCALESESPEGSGGGASAGPRHCSYKPKTNERVRSEAWRQKLSRIIAQSNQPAAYCWLYGAILWAALRALSPWLRDEAARFGLTPAERELGLARELLLRLSRPHDASTSPYPIR